MPELPEVETVVRLIAPRIAGRTITRAVLRPRSLYRTGSLPVAALAGGRVERVERLGKAIVVRMSGTRRGADVLVFHLGMTGRLVDRTVAKDARSAGAVRAPRHRHGRFVFDDGNELWYVDPRRFGYVFVGPAEALRARLHIGPDPFEVTPRELAARLGGRRSPIKALLLDQRIVSGIGNIYPDEILHRAKIHPARAGDSVADRAADLLRAARAVLTRAIRHRGTTLRDYRTPDGRSGGFQDLLRVYGREGQRCPRCGAGVRRIVLAGRGTHFCARCQRPPRAQRG